MPAFAVCRLPDAIEFETGAAMMLQGLTVQYLFRRTWPLEPGDAVLFHAAAGGVGLIACQWARAMGLTLIGTAGTDEKCRLAAENGAAHVINYRTEDWVARVKEIIALNRAGKKVDRLQAAEDIAPAAEEPTYRSEEDSITRFDQAKRRSKRGRGKGGRQNGTDSQESGRQAAGQQEQPDQQGRPQDRRPRRNDRSRNSEGRNNEGRNGNPDRRSNGERAANCLTDIGCNTTT